MNYLIVVYGINSIIAQSLIIREIISNFYSNEIFISFTIAGWLFSSIIGIYIADFFKTDKYIRLYHITNMFLLYLTLIIIKLIKTKLFPLSENPDLLISFIISFFSSLIISIMQGIYFRTVSEKYTGYVKTYYFDLLGYIIGGVIFYLSISNIKIEYLISILIFINIIILFQYTIITRISLIFLISISIFILSKINFSYTNKVFIETTNSKYSKIEVYKNQENVFIYSNSNLSSSNVKDISLELKAHTPFIFSKEAKKIALIGCDVNVADELLKYTTDVYIIDDDEKLFEYQKRYIRIRQNPIFIKTKEFIKQNNFDIILISYSLPDSIYLNKFYSYEFFKSISNKLKERGIVLIKLPYTQTTPQKNLKKSLEIIFNTLSKVFKHIKAFGEDEIFIIASNSDIKSNNYTIKTNILTQNHIEYYLSKEIILQPNSLVNIQKKPTLFLNSILYEISRFYPKTALLLDKNYLYLTIFIFILTFSISILLKNEPKTMYLTSFSAMSIEIISVFLYQLRYGYIYHDIVLIISLFMIGGVLGISFFEKNIIKKKINIILTPILILTIFIDTKIFIFLINLLSGLICGHTYAIMTNNYKKQEKIYIFDILGSIIASLFVSLLFIPVFGFNNTIILISLINLISLI